MVDVRFELTTNDPWSVDDAICEGISPLGYWQKVNQSPTQSKPYSAICEGIITGVHSNQDRMWYVKIRVYMGFLGTSWVLINMAPRNSPLGYWQKVNQSPTQSKPYYNTPPPFEQRDSWSSSCRRRHL